MLLSCPNCNASFSIADTFELQADNKYAQCCKCMHIWDFSQDLIKQHQLNIRVKDFIDNPLKQGVNIKAKDALSKPKTDEKRNINIFGSVIIFIIMMCIFYMLYKEHREYIFYENNIIVKDAKFNIKKDDLGVYYSLLNLSNKTIMLNKVTFIFSEGKKMQLIAKCEQPILLKPFQVKKISTNFKTIPQFYNKLLVRIKLG